MLSDVVGEQKTAETGGVPVLLTALLEASAEGRFDTQNPGAPLPLRAGVEAEDAIAVASRSWDRLRHPPRTCGSVSFPYTTGVEAVAQTELGGSAAGGGGGATGISAAIAGPTIAANATLARRNFFMIRPPSPRYWSSILRRLVTPLSPFSNIQKSPRAHG